MVRYSSAGNPIKPRKLVSTKGNFSLECDENILKVDVKFNLLDAREHEKVLAWLEQANAYAAYLRTDEFAFRKQQKEEHEKSYETHNGTRGNANSWKKQADRLKQRLRKPDRYLEILGIKVMPQDIKELNRARRNAMKKAHPDVGGSEELAKQVNDAYEILKARL